MQWKEDCCYARLNGTIEALPKGNGSLYSKREIDTRSERSEKELLVAY